MLKLPPVREAPEAPEAGAGKADGREGARVRMTQSARPAGPKGGWGGDAENPMARSMRILGWEAQAARYTDGARESVENHRWRSASVYCEVKLAEALAGTTAKKRRGAVPFADASAEGGDGAAGGPDARRTAICMHLLGDLAAMAGPFRRVLKVVHRELARAVYSDYYSPTQQASDDGPAEDAYDQAHANALAVAQEPYFRVVRNLEEERATMSAEREQWHRELVARAADVGRIEERITDLEGELASARADAAHLRTQLAEREDALTAARAETRHSKEELRKLRRELLSARDDAQAVRQAGRQAEADAAEADRTRRQVEMLQKELARALAETEKEKQRADELERTGSAERAAAEAALIAAQHKRRAAPVAAAPEPDAPRSLTPRPDWDEIRPFDDEPVMSTTAEVVTRLKDELASTKRELYDTQRAKGELDMLMEETQKLLDVDPEAHEMDPQALAERLAELEGDAASAPSGEEAAQRIASLGLGPEVPRYLRNRAKMVRLNALSKRECEELVNDVWDEKDAFDATRHTAMSLSSFLFDFLRKRHGTQRETAQAGYQFHAALRRYNYDADIELFYRILTGDISEEVRGDRERLVAGLQRALSFACAAHARKTGSSDGDGEAGPRLCPRAHFASIVNAFFPGKKSATIKAILRGLEEDQPGTAPVDVEALFEEDEDHNQGQFIETILDQHLSEVSEYSKGLEEAILALGPSPDDMVLMSDVKAAIVAFDPTKPAAEVDAYVARGAKLGALKDVHEMEAAAHTVVPSAFVTRLRTGLVKRSDNYDAAAAMATAHELAGAVGGSATLSQPAVA